jgi:hypothetical protein
LYQLFAMFVVLDFSSRLLISCLLMQRLHADGDADAARAPGRPSPTIHQTEYIPSSINVYAHHVQHCSLESMSTLTTFGVLGVHARGSNTMGFPHSDSMRGRHKNEKTTSMRCFFNYPPRITFVSFFHYLPLQRPLRLTPTDRAGCGLYSLVKTLCRSVGSAENRVVSPIVRFTANTKALVRLRTNMKKRQDSIAAFVVTSVLL